MPDLPRFFNARWLSSAVVRPRALLAFAATLCRLSPFRRRGRSAPARLHRTSVASLAAGVALTCVALAGAAPVRAATLHVTTNADELTSHDGKCSLREALAAVNSPGTKTDCGTASSTSNTIVVSAGDYGLSIAPSGADGNRGGDLNVTGTTPLTIRGAGQAATVIDASGLGDRVLSIATGATVALRKLEISGGHAPDGPAGEVPGGGGGAGAEGGGIYNDGTLSLIGVGVVGNTAGAGGAGGDGGCRGCRGGHGGDGGDGGGIYNADTLKVTQSAIRNNTAGDGGAPGAGADCGPFCPAPGGGGGGGGAGGGIYSASTAAKLTVTDSTIAGNRGGGGADSYCTCPGGNGGRGGGIANQNGTLVVSGSTIAGNTAGPGGEGGGALKVHAGPGGAGAWGGGISATGGPLRVTNSTLTGNAAGTGGRGVFGLAAAATGGHGGTGGDGGAIAATGLVSTSVVLNATVANNAAGAGGPGGGALNGATPGSDGAAGSGGGLAITSGGQPLTLKNTIVASNNANGAANCVGVVNSGHDLSYGDASCPGINANPLLQALADNGGPTQTMALGSGSPAIDQVPATGAGCPPTDQRGITRPQGPACDIGAFEFVP
jgi:CSLREA domain-containing protein